MRAASLAKTLIVLGATIAPAIAAGGDTGVARMATCQDSWLDWKTSDPAKLQAFAAQFGSGYMQGEGANGQFLIPKTPQTLAGLRITQVFPESVGMGVGFSVTVDAPFDAVRKSVETLLGKKLGKCETSDGMRACELELAPQRTVTVMAGDDPKSHATLVGCFYLYEK
jgi:hypothetical protein